ncbi:YlxR family protein [Fictibacillus nanhaiensis]|uniref:RNase P modulator RnpM n=1 Tax=Fictibacillus nanhaiensis TaxID=742169 RepID=UPI001C945C7C|nr:YlxR family protein [Fictibacillus nanhaiensis]MBY6036053.1 YlxR family protein [Fictibacillus nanhaiensis]
MKTRKIPMRKCVACQEMKAKKELTRIVRSPEGDVSVDSTGKKSGRGAYLCHEAACIEQAKKKKVLETHLKTKIPADLYEQLEKGSHTS